MEYSVAEVAARIIQLAEGCKLKAYWDVTGKVWTIGFGHTGPDVHQGLEITYERAVELLGQDTAALIERVKDRPVLEAGAMVSFGYNLGAHALKRLLTNSIQTGRDGFMADGQRYGAKSGGVELAGLVARRRLEAMLISMGR